jgi:hypothetical protein
MLSNILTASDKVYQLLAHGRCFSPASSTTKTPKIKIKSTNLLTLSVSDEGYFRNVSWALN